MFLNPLTLGENKNEFTNTLSSMYRVCLNLFLNVRLNQSNKSILSTWLKLSKLGLSFNQWCKHEHKVNDITDYF